MKLIHTSIAIALGMGSLAWATVARAEPPSISLAQRLGKSTVEQCVATSTQAMQKVQLQQVEADAESVTGLTDTARVVIYCNSESAGLVQTIIVAGNDLQENDRIIESLKKALP